MLHRVTGLTTAVLLDSIQSVWQEWGFRDRNIFQLKWIDTVVKSGILFGLGPQRQLLIECSGLGGAPIFDSIQGDLFLKCMPSAPVYGPSLAHLDVYADDRKHRHTTSIGRTAQIHDFHMLHAAAWPRGVNAWERILGLMNLPEIQEAKTSKILTQAGVLAATGKKLPAHLRNAHPDSVSFWIVFCLCPCVPTAPRLHGAVELLLTGDQHKPCASFNQHACKNTTSVAEGKGKTPQKIASKCANF